MDNKEHLLQVLQEKDRLLASEFEASILPAPGQLSMNGPLSRVLEQVEIDERESDLKIERIMADVA